MESSSGVRSAVAWNSAKTIEECAIRETFEEMGLRVRLVRLLSVARLRTKWRCGAAGIAVRSARVHGRGVRWLRDSPYAFLLQALD